MTPPSRASYPNESEPGAAPAAVQPRISRALHLLLAALLLALMFGLAAGSSLEKNPVAPEPEHMARGWALWRTGRLLPAASLPLADLLAGLGGLLEPGLPDPASLDGWQAGDAAAVGRALLWGSGIDTARAVFLFRLPVIGLGLLLAAVVYRWAADLYGQWGGALALLLVALSPNILAYTRLATPDLPRAAFFVMALFAWSRYLHRGAAGWLLAAGVAFGLALAAGFAGLLLIPVFILAAVWVAGRRGPLPLGRPGTALARLPYGWLWTALAVLLVLAVLGGGVLAAIMLATTRQPDITSAYVGMLERFLAVARTALRPYLLGRLNPPDFGYDTFAVLGLKLPTPTLLLGILAIASVAARPMMPREWDVAFPALLFFAGSLLDPLGPELRYLLALVVLAALFTARLADSRVLRPVWVAPALTALTVLLYAVLNVISYPHYLAYFNLAARALGDPAELLVGSNSDWGQDLAGLGEYLGQRDAGAVYLSYYGEAEPAAYGIETLNTGPLAGWPGFHPLNPAAGLYAISATHLAGALPGSDPNLLSAFHSREPVRRVGGSIYVYDVPPAVPPETDGAPAWLAMCARGEPPVSREQLAELTGLPGLRVFGFDCETSLAFGEGPGWLLLQAAGDGEIPTPVAELGVPDAVTRDEAGAVAYAVWRRDAPLAAPGASVAFPPVPMPVPVAGYLELIGYTTSGGALSPGDDLLVTTWWRVREPPPGRVSLQAGLVTADGQEIAVAEGLGVAVEDWQPGMILAQQHRLAVGGEVPPGSVSLVAGLVSEETGRRFPVYQSADRVIDRIVLRVVEITE